MFVTRVNHKPSYLARLAGIKLGKKLRSLYKYSGLALFASIFGRAFSDLSSLSWNANTNLASLCVSVCDVIPTGA